MRLKRLDIIGFKSFMDKTVVQFDDGITGVVGPNGCGKSNIVDAIRWVLGEQSPRHLRGASMSDVIFNGSQNRPPLGLAEVTLTVYNDNPDEIPGRYREFRELSVTRRLFRTGESEYLINKIPCRLMDVTELFLGTGVGTKAYSIIEQGRIGIIVSSKPEDRRSLIEEAAGITRYKVKKKAAERKMEATRNNLLRVGDLVGELGKRLDSLQRQAKKAERYKALKAELREIELHLAAHRWLEVTATRSLLATRIAALAEEATGLAAEVAELEGDLRRRRDRLAAEEARLADLQSKAAEAEGQAKVHEERVSGLEREQASLHQRTLEAREEIASLQARLEALAQEREAAEALSAELQALMAEDKARLEAEAEALARGAEESARLTGLVEAERAGALDAVRVLSEGKSHLAALEKQRLDVQARQGRGDEERARLEGRIEEVVSGQTELEGKVDTSRQLHLRLEEDRKAQEQSLVQVRAGLAEVRAKVAALKDELSQRRSRLESLVEIQRNYEGYDAGVRSVMLHKDEIEGVAEGSVLGLVADVVRAPSELEQAVEAVLDARLQWILVEDAETARRLAWWLRDAAAGRSSFVPVGALAAADAAEAARALMGRPGVVAAVADVAQADPAYAEVVRLLLGSVVVVEDLPAAERLRAEAPGVTFVTRAGEVLEASGVLTGGVREGAGTGLLEKRREIDELTAEVRRLESVLAVEVENERRLDGRRASLEEGVKRLEQESHAEQLSLVAQEKELHRLSDEVSRLRERLSVLDLEREQHEHALREIALEEERTQVAMTAAEADQTTREARVKALGEELEQAREAHEALQAEVTRLKVKTAADAERRDGALKEIERVGRTRVEIETRLAQLDGLVQGSGSAFEGIETRMDEGRKEAGRLMAEAERLRAELGRARETVSAAGRQLKQDEARLDDLRTRHESLATEKSEHSLEDRELELELRHLDEAVEERHAIPLGQAIHEWHLAPPPTEIDLERQAELRGKVERMGEVNLTAISEFEELSERHTFLSAQKEDLERSLEQLGKAITKINRTSKVRFQQTFDAVNERFQKLFPRLFNGGKASLAMTDPSNPLETGVEIFAQPPGKKLQSVNLLSGGEKALTAVSLLFAIFLVRPTPFCLLDEVDAPLDDNNVDRYNNIVREMSERSQFILITHNKKTMEFSDTLYGVTMEEPGCSKLVSVRLKDTAADPGTRATAAA